MLCRAMPEARKLIMKGCDLCPHSEDVWLEAARLQTPEHAKALLARGVSYNQTSVKLWIQVGLALTLSPQAWLLQGRSHLVYMRRQSCNPISKQCAREVWVCAEGGGRVLREAWGCAGCAAGAGQAGKVWQPCSPSFQRFSMQMV